MYGVIGDCDSDNECLGELVCYQGGISLYEIPPECFNAGDVTVGLKDFCAASQSSTPPPSVAPATPSRGTLLEFLGSSGCTVSAPCDECQGKLCHVAMSTHHLLSAFTI